MELPVRSPTTRFGKRYGRVPGRRTSWRAALSLCLASAALLVGVSEPGLATPPEYLSFHRLQRIDHTPDADALLRIWVIYIGQGDALLIQFPPAASETSERVEMLVDGGPSGRQLLPFLNSLDPRPGTLEHVVLTHHDGDHVAGLTALLEDEEFGVGNIYHNGLASWSLGSSGFPVTDWPRSSKAVFQKGRGKGMALLEPDGRKLQAISLISSLDRLRTAVNDGDLVGGYGELGRATAGETTPRPIAGFQRTRLDDPALAASGGAGGVQVKPLWPLDPPRRYGGWSYTINGNSVTFKLEYEDFSMLFTGDHNEDSEAELLRTFEDADRLDVLRSDVLKVPHHGSKHGLEAFFDAVNPVVSVASMGSRGFQRDWRHPSTEVVRWLGGAHRVYHTYIHERRFRYEHLKNKQVRNSLIETTHVLIETDGRWFRIVEVEDPAAIPSVRQTRRGNGTRWIRARE